MPKYNYYDVAFPRTVIMGKLKKILQANMCCGGQRSLRKGPSLSSLLVDEHLSKGDYLIMKMVRIKSNDKHLGVFQHRKLHTQP